VKIAKDSIFVKKKKK